MTEANALQQLADGIASVAHSSALDAIADADGGTPRTHLMADHLFNRPLWLHPDKAETLAGLYGAHLRGELTDMPRPEAVEFRQTGERKPYAVTTAGIAIVPIVGSLVHRAFGLAALSGISSYTRIARQITAAAEDREVRAILLEVDSPGGEVAGLADLTGAIAAARQAKPVWAIANEAAYSAGYAIAAAADKIYLPRSAGAGSIGVVMLHLDESEKNRKAGLNYTPIFAGAHKVDFARFAPLSDAARARAQALVDDAYGLFVAHVVANRPMSEADVRGTEAQIFTAPEAEERGLVDGIAGLDETLSMLEAASGSSVRIAAQSATGETTMSDTKPEATFNQADLDTARNAGIEAGRTEGAATERARIQGILNHEEATGRTGQAMHLAFSTSMTVDEAAGLLAASPREQSEPEAANGKTPFEAHMEANGNQHVQAGGATEDEDGLNGQSVGQRTATLLYGKK